MIRMGVRGTRSTLIEPVLPRGDMNSNREGGCGVLLMWLSADLLRVGILYVPVKSSANKELQ